MIFTVQTVPLNSVGSVIFGVVFFSQDSCITDINSYQLQIKYIFFF
jgi:hypothetical protein